MAEERKSWNSLLAVWLTGEAIDRVVSSVEGTMDNTTVAEMLAARVEEVRLITNGGKIRLNPIFCSGHCQ